MTSRVPLPVAAVFVLAAALIFGAYWENTYSGTVTSAVPSKFTASGKTFQITDFATTSDQRAKGLMNRVVSNTTIMLFVFPQPGQYSFWMLNTNTSLDMIWVDTTGGAGRVVYVVSSAQPCYVASSCAVYTPSAPSNYVLEAKAGFANTSGIGVGTAIQFS
jgi:uncharacterized membrane protein (UPF0127 family)